MEKLFYFVAVTALIFFSWILFMGLVHLYAAGQCLKKGYPEAKVTITLDRYCVALEGDTTIRVVKQ